MGISFQIKAGEIIGLAGYKGAGKSTLAKHLTAASRGAVVRMAFADPLKEVAETFLMQLGITHEGYLFEMLHGSLKETPIPEWGELTPRHILQTLGTEWGRVCIAPDLWVRLTMGKAQRCLDRGCGVVIDDVRLPNEVEAIRAIGGKVILITNPAVGRTSDHVSETLPDYDEEFINDWRRA